MPFVCVENVVTHSKIVVHMNSKTLLIVYIFSYLCFLFYIEN